MTFKSSVFVGQNFPDLSAVVPRREKTDENIKSENRDMLAFGEIHVLFKTRCHPFWAQRTEFSTVGVQESVIGDYQCVEPEIVGPKFVGISFCHFVKGGYIRIIICNRFL